MSNWIELCRAKSSLSSVQMDILKAVMLCLPFVKELTKGEISVYVPKKDKSGYLQVLGANDNDLSPVKSALIADSFRTGKAFNQWEESDIGGRGLRSFSVKNGKETIAVITLSYRLTLPMAEFTHLLHAVEFCISYGRKFDPAVWRKLTDEDGVMIADRFGRVVFADDIIRHIYRYFGVGSLLGRNIFDEDLKEAVTKETFNKKSPWEREMTAGDKIVRERRLNFLEGGENKGYLIILADITSEKKREQDEKIQAALKERIAELEEELADIKNSLAARKLVDRAKGYLMDKEGLTEEESYRRIQRLAMMNRMTIKEVAERILRGKK